jgi:hypothetical protein
LQVYVYLKTSGTKRELVSIIISALTAGFSSAVISYDFDVSPQKRLETPSFYGYVPVGSSRTLIFGCMVLNSALQLVVTSFSAALLMLANTRYYAWYLSGNMGLYLLWRVARGDFWYWIPIDGNLGLLTSLVVRVIVKSLTDFTGVVQFRHPHELGGSYWTANMAMVALFSAVAVVVHYNGAGEARRAKVSEQTAWYFVVSVNGAWVLVFGAFLYLMKPEYRKTFFSFKTGKQNSMDYFLSDDDAVKCQVLGDNRNMWKEIEPEVKEWVQAGWERWEDETPEWFTDAFKRSVDDSWLPMEELRRQTVMGGGVRRRSSVGEMFGVGGAGRKRSSAAVFPGAE